MDAQEIRALLGKSIFERAQKYRKRILQSSCTTNEDGVRHLTALVQGSGPDCYYTQVWLRENGSFVSASCDCPYNQNGDGTYCKHIGALLLQDAEKNPPAPEKKPESIPGVQRGVAGLNPEPRKDSYSAGLDMLFGRKWRGEEPETDYEAQLLLKRYQREDAQPQPQNAAQRTGFALLEPELTPHNGRIWLRLRVSDGIGGRQYLVKSIPQFLDAIERGESVSYGKSLAFVHRWDAFAPDAQQLLRLLRRQVSARQEFEAEGTVRSGWEKGPAGGLPLTGEGLDALVELYAAEGVVGGYTLKEGLPVISLKVERRKGGVQLSCTPALSGVQGLDYAYLLGETTLWRMQREECRRVLPVLDTFGGRSLFFTSADAAAFCSYVLPELGNRVNIVDPDRLLLNQIPLEPVVQFYLDADRGLTVTAYPVFLYGEDRVAPGEPVPPDLLRDARTENRAKRLLETYLEPETGKPGHYSLSGEEALFQLLEEGIPALLAMGEVYQTDAFRNLQAAPPKISVGVSVHGSVLDLEVDTGAFPVEELRELLQSLHQKKRYHRLRDGSLLRLDDNLEGLDTGADAYLMKPFSIELLRKTVLNLIRRREQLRNAFSGRQNQEEQISIPEVKSPDDRLMERVMRVINENLGNPALTVEMISTEVGISRVHLHRKLKELTNQTTQQLIRNLRLKQAATLLADKRHSITEVATLTGFTHPTYFATAFREMYGISPSEYMERHIGQDKTKDGIF